MGRGTASYPEGCPRAREQFISGMGVETTSLQAGTIYHFTGCFAKALCLDRLENQLSSWKSTKADSVVS